jgi:predicted nucleotidyltransferase
MNRIPSKNPVAEQTEKGLKSLMAKYPSICAAYLFGSTAQGTATSKSDMDIAVRMDPALPKESYFDIRLELTNELERSFSRRADVVVLNNASLKMIRQVLTNGILVFAKDPEKEIDYAVQKQKEYFDFKYYMDKDSHLLKAYYGASENV